MNSSKICIIYWGLIRGFKYDYTFNTHKKQLYKKLDDNNLDYDVYIVTNNIDYDDKNINKINNLKMLKIIPLENIYDLEEYKNVYNNIEFTGPWSDYFQKNLITLYYNKQQLKCCIPNDYKRYISMDIGQIIDRFDISLINNTNNITSSFECSCGLNPRFLIGDYNCIYYELNKFNYILNSPKKLFFNNPEKFLEFYFKNNNINISLSDLVNVLRIRSDGTNQNGIKYFKTF
jgi:hypothetical protein